MPFLDAMHEYFRGEKLEAMLFIAPVGAALVAFGAVALKAERGGFAWGVAVPAIVFGLVLLAVGVVVATRTSGQVEALERTYAEAPASLARDELGRMRKVNANFRATYYAFGALVALGLVLHYLVRAGWGRGLGAVLVLGGALGLLIDAFAERRAEPYTRALEELGRQHPEGPS